MCLSAFLCVSTPVFILIGGLHTAAHCDIFKCVHLCMFCVYICVYRCVCVWEQEINFMAHPCVYECVQSCGVCVDMCSVVGGYKECVYPIIFVLMHLLSLVWMCVSTVCLYVCRYEQYVCILCVFQPLWCLRVCFLQDEPCSRGGMCHCSHQLVGGGWSRMSDLSVYCLPLLLSLWLALASVVCVLQPVLSLRRGSPVVNLLYSLLSRISPAVTPLKALSFPFPSVFPLSSLFFFSSMLCFKCVDVMCVGGWGVGGSVKLAAQTGSVRLFRP